MDTIINELLNNKTNITQKIEEHLEKLSKKEYTTLIENLIKISHLKEEIGYTTPLLTLSSIEKDTFKFDIKKYIDFYINSNSELEKSYYLNIIKNSTIFTSNETEEEQIAYATNYLKSLINIAKERGIIILDPMDAKTRYIINKAADNIEELTTYTIHNNDISRIVIRYIRKDKIDINKILNKAKFYYNKGRFEEAIKEYLKILKIKKIKPKLLSMIYFKLGLSKLKLKHDDLGKDYLSMCAHLIKDLELKNYVLDLIEKIEAKETITLNDKTYVVMDEEEFLDRTTNNFNNLILELLKKGNNINEITNRLQLTEEEKLLSLILQAQIYYKNEYYKQGDENLRKVEKCPNKTEKVITELTQTRKDKRLYKYR